ncbi:unnamed protein product [Dracunculus medinensis]|uniref:DsbC domain-containing protein n=1 Tax=Dracunculus medinensis TaxID=318479 RepID=A0A0N4UJ11_DRAME|nr:unnamed protein product [Dracunculus medinensis]
MFRITRTPIITHSIIVISAITAVFSQFNYEAGKPCMAAYECWRTEPIDVDGKPVSLRGRYTKRLEIGGPLFLGGEFIFDP